MFGRGRTSRENVRKFQRGEKGIDFFEVEKGNCEDISQEKKEKVNENEKEIKNVS